MRKIVLLILVLLITGCNLNASENPAPVRNTSEAVSGDDEAAVEEVMPPEEAAVEEIPTPDGPFERDRALVIAGEEEIVYDWSSERCEEEHIPDIAPRAFRDAEDMVYLTIGHLTTYGMIGPDLDSVKTDCSALMMTSDLNDDPTQFNDGEWIGGLYTEDGNTIYAILHSEYRGLLHTSTRPGQCPSGDYLTCLDTALTMAISTDGGKSFQDFAPSPDHLVATLPYQYNDQGISSGLRQPSNIIKGPDDYFYVYSSLRDYPIGDQWICLMRTDNLADPGSWRYWDGSGFTGKFLTPISTT